MKGKITTGCARRYPALFLRCRAPDASLPTHALSAVSLLPVEFDDHFQETRVHHSLQTVCASDVRYYLFCLFFVNDTATTEIYTLSLHDALPIHSHSWTVPASSAFGIRSPLSRCLALKHTGQTMNVPPAFSYRASRSGSGGQPSQATPVATPVRASRTASLAWNINVGRPASAAPTATRNATVTFSGSSRPVVRLITALPAIAASPFA